MPHARSNRLDDRHGAHQDAPGGEPDLMSAIFEATRAELTGDSTLADTAELARQRCVHADRTFSLVAVTTESLRRIDGWLDDVGIVTHAAAPDSDTCTPGSLSAREQAVDLVGAIVTSMTGAPPTVAATGAVTIDDVRALAPSSLPAEWVVVAVSTPTSSASGPPRFLVIADADGLVAAAVDSLDGGLELTPTEPDELPGLLADLLAPAPRSLADLLAD